MEISVRIMSHPVRRRLANRVAAQAGPAEIVYDPDPWGNPGTLRTAAHAWASMDPDATHHLLLQDDITLAPGFLDRVRMYAESHPDLPIAFFTNWASRNGAVVRYAARAGAAGAWAVPEYVPTQALLLPDSVSSEFVDYVRRNPDSGLEDDDALRLFFAAVGTPLLLAVPNLVEHLSVRSVAGNDGHGDRAASVFATDTELPPPVPSVGRASPAPAEPVVLPYFYKGRVWLYERDDDTVRGTSRMYWRKSAFEASAGVVGVDIAAVSEEYAAYLGTLSDSETLALFSLCPPRALWSAWLACYLLTAGSHLDAFEAGKPDGSLPTSRVGVRSLLVGGLAPEIPPHVVDKQSHLFFPLALAAMESGTR